MTLLVRAWTLITFNMAVGALVGLLVAWIDH